MAMKPRLFVMALLIAFLAVDLFYKMRSHEFDQWFVTVFFFVGLMSFVFFRDRWVSRQNDELKSLYRATNISMWVFLLLATVSILPNFFISGQINETLYWPVFTFSFMLLGESFMKRRSLLRELSERQLEG